MLRAPACSRCRPASSRPPPSPPRPSAAAENDVAMEKKTTVPPSAVARIAPCSAPGTSTQTTVTSTGVPTAAATASGSVASATTTRSARPAARQGRGLGLVPHQSGELAGARGTGGGQAQAAGLAGGPEDDDRPRAALRSTTRAVAAGAPQTSRTASETASGRSSGSTAAMERAKRIAVPSAGTCSDAAVPAGQPVGEAQRREGEGDEGGDPLPDGAGPAATRGRPRRRRR